MKTEYQRKQEAKAKAARELEATKKRFGPSCELSCGRFRAPQQKQRKRQDIPGLPTSDNSQENPTVEAYQDRHLLEASLRRSCTL